MDKDQTSELIHEYAIDRGGRYGVLVPEENFRELAGAISQAHEEEITGLLSEVKAFREERDIAWEKADALQAQVAVMAEALRAIERDVVETRRACPLCLRLLYFDGHHANCQLSQALSAAPKMLFHGHDIGRIPLHLGQQGIDIYICQRKPEQPQSSEHGYEQAKGAIPWHEEKQPEG